MRYHHQNLSDGKKPLWRYGRAWWGRLHWGWGIGRPSELLLLGFHLSGFCVYLRSIHFYVDWGERDDRDSGRFEIGWSDGAIYLEHPWCRQDGWARSDPWWKHRVRLSVVDWILGRTKMSMDEGDAIATVVPMPEGQYRATARPYTVTHKRPRWFTRQWHGWKIDVPRGIPYAGKGENSWDCGDDGLWGLSTPAASMDEAIGKVVSTVLERRSRYGHDSKGTGRTPSMILNEEKDPQ